MKKIPVIDVFAGPGGLCEGFSRYSSDGENNYAFEVALSVEYDKFAWGTLRRRALYRSAFLVGSDGAEAVEKYFQYAKKIVEARGYGSRCSEAKSGAKEIDFMERFFKKTADRVIFPNGIDDKTGKAPLDLTKESAHKRIAETVKRLKSRSEHWVLIGGPPCQAYSLSGRSRMQSIDPVKFLDDQRHVLYRQYVRIIREHKPSVFIMENVEGILSSPDPAAKDQRVFDAIRRIVSNPTGKKEEYLLYSLTTGAEAEDSREFLVKAEFHGIPQRRRRVFIVGVRKDLQPPSSIGSLRHVPKRAQPSTGQAISDLPPLRSMISFRVPGTSDELDPAEFIGLSWAEAIRKAIVKREPWMNKALFKSLYSASLDLNDNLETSSAESIHGAFEANWFLKENHHWFRPTGSSLVLNHFTRSHKPSDLVRYLFVAMLTEKNEESPRMRDLMSAGLQPLHRSAKHTGNHDDRFKTHPRNKVAKTIVSHAGKDGHANIHYDPKQCRSLTVREAARLQTFPDDYLFEGPMVEQFKQVGNAVPPLLAKQIANIVHKILT